MTSRERVEKTINHQEPDRVPVGEWGIDHDHVSKIIGHHTYWRNRKDTTLALWEGRRDEVVESLKNDCVELIERLDYDIITVELVPEKGYMPGDPPKKVADGVWEDKRGNVYKYAASNDSISRITHSEGKYEVTQEDIDRAFKNVYNMNDSVFELIDFIGNKYGKEKAVLCRSMDIYSSLMNVFGGDWNHNLILTLESPDEIKKMYESCLEYNKVVLEHCVKSNVMIAMQGQDFGMNSGCIMSPNSIRDIYMPIMKSVNDLTVKNGIIPFFHCCGKIWDIMDDYIAAGYKGYQSIQESAGMDSYKVKQMYGDKLTLWTGIQCETLVEGSLEDTEKEVTRNLERLMPNGGFIFGSTNSVQYGAKTENYLKALDIVRTKGIYK